MPATTFFLVFQQQQTFIVSPACHLRIRVVDPLEEDFEEDLDELRYYLRQSAVKRIFQTVGWEGTTFEKIVAALHWYAAQYEFDPLDITCVNP